MTWGESFYDATHLHKPKKRVDGDWFVLQD